MPLQKDARPLVVKTDDVLYDLLTPPNDYLPEERKTQHIFPIHYFEF